jgi:hypothetical protein
MSKNERHGAKATYCVKLTKSQFGPDTPKALCDVSSVILSKFR